MLTPIFALKNRKMILNTNKFKNIQNLDIENSESCIARNNFCLNWTFYICNETWFCIISCTAKPVFLSVNNYFELLEGKWSITFAWFPPYYRIESTIKREKNQHTKSCALKTKEGSCSPSTSSSQVLPTHFPIVSHVIQMAKVLLNLESFQSICDWDIFKSKMTQLRREKWRMGNLITSTFELNCCWENFPFVTLFSPQRVIFMVVQSEGSLN